MPPLKNLEQEFAAIDPNFQSFCASHGIFSVEDFLVNDLYVLVAFAEREPTAELLKQGITQVLSIIDGQHQPWLNGVELLNDALQNKHFLSTGLEGIDLLLGGGLREGQLTEIAGQSSSGKTQVCLYAAASVTDNNLGAVMFLDTGNSFSPKRVVSIVNQLSNTSVKEHKERRVEGIMSNILCRSVFDIFQLLDIVNLLAITMKHQGKNEDTKLRLLIVDSISSLITPVLGGKDSQGRSLMVSVGFELKKLAQEHNVSVLVTNHTVSRVGGTTKPALGESWKSIPHVRLLLFRDSGTNICNVSVLKSTSTVVLQNLLSRTNEGAKNWTRRVRKAVGMSDSWGGSRNKKRPSCWESLQLSA